MKAKLLLPIGLVLLCSFAFPNVAYAACSWNGNTGTVASPYAASDVQACINDAAGKTGDVIIQIPDSSVTWASSVSVDMSSGWAGDSITIRGQNSCTTTTTTHMVPSSNNFPYPTACGTNITNMKMYYKGKLGKAFNLLHFRTTGTSGVQIDGDSKSWRFGYIIWENITGAFQNRVFWIQRSQLDWMTEGVIDHNYATFPTNVGQVVFWYLFGNAEYIAPFDLGGSSAAYIENCKMTWGSGGGSPTDSNGGGRTVVRYNEMINAYIGGHDDRVRPSGMRGFRKTEVYGNYMDLSAANNYWIYYMAGNGVFFNNTVIKLGASLAFDLHVTRAEEAGHGTCGNTTSGNDYLGSVAYVPAGDNSGCTLGVNGCIKVDGIAAGPTPPSGYPCRDQIGASGNDPQVGGGQPFLLWGNTLDGGTFLTPLASSYVINNRDFCIASTCSGTTCSYTCGSTTVNYTAYTYPHPLTKGIINAANCSQQAVQAAVNNANYEDTVVVPSGNCIWSNTLVITKGITLQGAGGTNTQITGSGTTQLIYIHLSSDVPVRITGINFKYTSSNPSSSGNAIDAYGQHDGSWAWTKLRIDHNRFDNGATNVYIEGWIEGVFDHNTLVNNRIGIMIIGDNNYAWSRPITAGTSHAFFIEDNTFTVDNNINYAPDVRVYHTEGARSVVRYNTFDQSAYTHDDTLLFDSHGNQNYYTGSDSSDYRGQPILEIYNNTFKMYSTYADFMELRGGSMVIHDNTFTHITSSPYGMWLWEEEAWQTSFFSPLRTAWPAEDQVTNTFIWNNTLNGSPITDVPTRFPSEVTFIQKDRDYFMHAPASSGGKSTYPTRPGASDMTFSSSGINAYYPYTPYPYPHPLTFSGNPQTCSGTCCPSGQVCSTGSFTPSSDCSSCCTGTCRTPSCPDSFCDPGETCSYDNCCNGQVYSLGTQVCCSGSLYTGTCCSDSDCTSPKTCINHVCTQLCDNLMLLMHFDNQAQYGESPTNIYDFSKNGNNGTVTGATWSSSGKFSGAFTFDGTNDLINVSIPSGSTLDIDSNPVTIAAWIKPNTVSAQQAVIAKGKSDGISAGNDGYGLWINSSGKINVGSFGGGNFDGNSVLSTNTWYHVAVIINGASSVLYLNGLDNTPTSHTINVVASSQPLKIGASRNLTDTADVRFFNGTIDELAIWNRSLSSQEIQSLYSSGQPIPCGASCLHKSDSNCNGCVSMPELNAFIGRWKYNNQDVNIRELIEAIGLYNRNKGCP